MIQKQTIQRDLWQVFHVYVVHDKSFHIDRRNEYFIIKLFASKSRRRLFSELTTAINIIEDYGDELEFF